MTPGPPDVTPGMAEYVALRVARRFLFTDAFLLRFGRFIPHYRTNANQADAGAIVDMYARLCEGRPIAPPDKRVILEVGSGATNAVGYALAERGWAGEGGRVILLEPFVALDEAADRALRERLPAGVDRRVERTRGLEQVPPGSVDLVLSHSVLEHVRDPAALARELDRVLAPTGLMLHVVDYRDHFFKYPYHFLLFSKGTWERWLDPGDLPRWRLGDHVRQFRAQGFQVDVLESESLPQAFGPIAGKLSSEFDARDPDVSVTRAVLAIRRPA